MGVREREEGCEEEGGLLARGREFFLFLQDLDTHIVYVRVRVCVHARRCSSYTGSGRIHDAAARLRKCV